MGRIEESNRSGVPNMESVDEKKLKCTILIHSHRDDPEIGK